MFISLVIANVSTNVLPIVVGQTFHLTSTKWTDALIDNSGHPPPNAFDFKTNQLEASPVVYLSHGSKQALAPSEFKSIHLYSHFTMLTKLCL